MVSTVGQLAPASPAAVASPSVVPLSLQPLREVSLGSLQQAHGPLALQPLRELSLAAHSLPQSAACTLAKLMCRRHRASAHAP